MFNMKAFPFFPLNNNCVDVVVVSVFKFWLKNWLNIEKILYECKEISFNSRNNEIKNFLDEMAFLLS